MYKVDPAIAIDSYKLSHMTMYPKDTTKVYCNFTARSFKRLRDSMPKGFYNNKVVVFGISAAFQEIHEAFEDNFFNRDIEEVLTSYKEHIRPFMGDNDTTLLLNNIENLHKLGYLPLVIKSLPEGAQINENIPMMTITNTHPDFAWLPNYLETFLSSQIWKLSTAATIAKVFKNIFEHYAELTGTPKEFTMFQGHDFSNRGMSGFADSARTGSGHLTSFMGTDSVSSIDYVKRYYGATGFIGASIPASEHSVMCMGEQEGEADTFRRIFKMFPRGAVSIVSDTWDYWNTLTELASELKPEIMGREKDSTGLCKTVFRPDSGNPVDVIVGTNRKAISVSCKEEAQEYMEEALSTDTPHGEYGGDYECIVLCEGVYYDAYLSVEWNRYDKQYYFIEEAKITKWEPMVLQPEAKGSVQCLWETFGGTETATGHKQLDEHVGLIYGDSITPQRAVDMLQGLADKGFASGNVVMGIGSYTYQYMTRDTLGFAMKATYAVIAGVGKQIFKAPKTDSGKNSAKGMLRVDLTDGEYVLTDGLDDDTGGELKVIFSDGSFNNLPTLNEIRERLNG